MGKTAFIWSAPPQFIASIFGDFAHCHGWSAKSYHSAEDYISEKCCSPIFSMSIMFSGFEIQCEKTKQQQHAGVYRV